MVFVWTPEIRVACIPTALELCACHGDDPSTSVWVMPLHPLPQQSGWAFIAHLRSWLPNPIKAVMWCVMCSAHVVCSVQRLDPLASAPLHRCLKPQSLSSPHLCTLSLSPSCPRACGVLFAKVIFLQTGPCLVWGMCLGHVLGSCVDRACAVCVCVCLCVSVCGPQVRSGRLLHVPPHPSVWLCHRHPRVVWGPGGPDARGWRVLRTYAHGSAAAWVGAFTCLAVFFLRVAPRLLGCAVLVR